MRVIGYTRVSTAKQASDGDSLDVQRDKVATYCDLHDYELVDMYEDAGASAKDLKRNGLRAALGALEAGEADGLVVFKLDRLTRSTADLGRLLEEFEAHGVALQAVAESLDTSTAGGRMVVRMLGVVAEWERETIGERTSAALQAKADRGEYTGGEPPFGYQLSDNQTSLEEDPEEQKVIDTILNHRADGASLREIGDRLEAAGVTTRNGGRFWPTSIRRILDRQQEAA